MQKDKNKFHQVEYDYEGELTVHQQLTEAYQSGVIDNFDQGQKRTQLDEEESLQ